MYLYTANKSHLNRHQSRDKALAEFVDGKSIYLDGFMEIGHVNKIYTKNSHLYSEHNIHGLV